LDEIFVFFDTYKRLEKKKWVKITGWSTETETMELVKRTHNEHLKCTNQTRNYLA